MYIDIAVGLIIGWLVSLSTGDQHFMFMAFGVLATLAPDIDFIIWLARNKWQINQFAHEHRDLLHRPLLFGLGGGLLIALWDPAFGLVWFLGTMAHFIHDTFDGGWGIQWLHPFYFGYFTLASYSPKRHIQNLTEQREIAGIHGSPRWTDWKQGTPWNVFKFSFRLIVSGITVIVCLWWLRTR